MCIMINITSAKHRQIQDHKIMDNIVVHTKYLYTKPQRLSKDQSSSVDEVTLGVNEVTLKVGQNLLTCG